MPGHTPRDSDAAGSFWATASLLCWRTGPCFGVAWELLVRRQPQPGDEMRFCRASRPRGAPTQRANGAVAPGQRCASAPCPGRGALLVRACLAVMDSRPRVEPSPPCRGCKATPHHVNTVAILTDTTHAVTCGNDAVCFVWSIRSGTAVQAYFPDDPEYRGRTMCVPDLGCHGRLSSE